MVRILPRWSSNAGYLLATKIAHGGEAWLNCGGCGTREPLNLPAIIEREGPLWSPWNRRPKSPKCGKAMLINGHWTKGTMVVPFIDGDPDQVAELHRAWAREKRRQLRGWEGEK
jgi:hypothetical protein